MWQKARIIDPDFEPPGYRNEEIWVKDRPFTAEFHELLRTDNEILKYANYNTPLYKGEWMLTNLGFPNGQRARVWKESIELLPDFQESVPLIDVNTGAIIAETA